MAHTVSERFLHTLEKEHDDLLEEIANIKQFWLEVYELGRGPKYEEMAFRVNQLRKRLEEHFAEEERHGYLEVALDRVPRFAKRVDELKDQHPQLLEALMDLSQRLEAREAAFRNWEEVHAEFQEFLRRLQKHEAGEIAIVQVAVSEENPS